MTDASELLELAEQEEDESLLQDFGGQIDALENRITEVETRRLLGDPHDRLNAFVHFSPGAGGVDSADWAECRTAASASWERSPRRLSACHRIE